MGDFGPDYRLRVLVAIGDGEMDLAGRIIKVAFRIDWAFLAAK